MCGPMWASAPTQFCGGGQLSYRSVGATTGRPRAGNAHPYGDKTGVVCAGGRHQLFYRAKQQPPLHKGAVKSIIYAFFFLVSIARAAKLMNSAPHRGILLLSAVAGTE